MSQNEIEDNDFDHGSCHCGSLRFIAKKNDALTKPIECDCSYCSKTGYRFCHMLPDGEVKLTSDWSSAVEYKFGEKRYRHKFCSICGSSMAVVAKDGKIVTVNARMIKEFPPKTPLEQVYNGAELLDGWKPPAPIMPEDRADGNLLYHGSCHCQEIKYNVLTPRITSANECGCSICWRNACLWIYPMKPQVNILCGENSLAVYRFGSKIAGHAFCRVCGVNLFNLLRLPDDDPLAPVNVRTLEGIQPLKLERKPQEPRIELPDGQVVERELGSP